MNRVIEEDTRFSYLKDMSQKELEALKKECEDEMAYYDKASRKEQSDLEYDRNRAKAVNDYIEKNNLIKNGKKL